MSIWARMFPCPIPAVQGAAVALSPDGTRLVYASGSPSKLFTRRLDQAKATEFPGTQGASTAFFSPDGQRIGFYSAGKVHKISVECGGVVPLGATTNFVGAGWSEDASFLDRKSTRLNSSHLVISYAVF